jgi:RNA polymerase sigma-70 factor (ECF subfamily)
LNTSVRYSEEELIALLKQRSENAFSYLYNHYSGALLGVISSIIVDMETASDVLQETFVNIWKNFNSYDASKGRLFTWMLNIARNASIDKTRSKGYKALRKNQSLEDNVLRSAGNAVTNPSFTDFGLKKILSNLKEEYRVLIDLSFFQGYTHEEIAKALSIPLGTVKTRIRTALIQLRTMIK